MKTLLPLVFVLLCLAGNAQTPPCYTDQIWQRITQANPAILQLRNETENAISKISNETTLDAQHQNDDRAESVPAFVIPTVIYIVHDGTAASNISMQQIQSQMDQLNEDFAPHGYAFCYAKRNVNDNALFVPEAGDSAGVIRINNAALADLDEYAEDAQLKALSPLPYQRYLRIFVVANISPAGVLGYAFMPGSGFSRDGIVVRADVFGSNNYCQGCSLKPQYNLGKTLTHEAGHYLNLYHTFQGGCTPEPQPGITCQTAGDRVCDTPPTEGTFGCPAPAPLSCGTSTAQQVENYMDYTNDGCKTMFTSGQNVRMGYSITAYRNTLVSADNLIRTGITCTAIGNQYADIYCANFNGCVNMSMTFMSLNSPGFTYTWNFGDGTTGTGDTVQHTYSATGRYQLSLSAVNTAQGISVSKTITVFVVDCQPVNCAYNKWSGNYTYIDFSSGMAVATNHPRIMEDYPFPSFCIAYYRADNQGTPLFHYTNFASPANPNYGHLLNSSYQPTDSLFVGYSTQILPVTGTPGKYCVINNKAAINVNSFGNSDSILYTYIQVTNGLVKTIPGKTNVKVTLPPSAFFYTGNLGIVSIPNCDGTLFWSIAYINQGKFAVLKMDGDTVALHSVFTVPTGGVQTFQQITASPDGRKILAGPIVLGNGNRGYYILNFNKGTGSFTSYTTIDQGSNLPATGAQISFSPNSRFVYLTDLCCAQPSGNTGHLYQVDLYAANPWLSKKSVYEFPRTDGNNARPAQIMCVGPDKRLYIGQGNTPDISSDYRLGVINFPDVLEDGSNSVGYNRNGPDIIPPNCPFSTITLSAFGGLHDRHAAYGCNWSPNAPPTYNAYAVSCAQYNFYTDECYSSTWNFGDPASGANNTSTLSNPTHTFSAPGSYAISLTSNGQTFTDTIYIQAPATAISQSPVACGTTNSTYSVAQPQPGVKYIWTITGGTPASVTGSIDVNVQWNTGTTNGQIKLVAIDTLYGCTDSSVNNVTVSQGSIIEPLVAVNAAVLSTGTYATYQWLLNGTVIPNATQQQYTATETGLYSVIVSNSSACVDTSKTVQVTITGIDEIASPTLELYPNPATQSLTITTSQTDVKLNIYDTHGRLVHQQALSDTTQTLNIGNWNGGIYYVELSSRGKTARKKFVKL